MPPRQYSKEQSDVGKATKRITLPIELAAYRELAADGARFRQWLDRMIACYPELFPSAISAGYTLHDWLPAGKKLPAVRFRRIKLKQPDEAGQALILTIASSAVLPYMSGYTDEVEKALFLRRFGVPFWGLTYVFGRDDSYWYRLTASFGRYDIVGTTVKEPTRLPAHLLADEKHVHFNGEKGYIATTVGADCVLGASLALAADEAALTDAYAAFQREAQGLVPDYAPQTVNTDGWWGTQRAWCALFPGVVLIACFLHAFLKIRDRAKRRFKQQWPAIQQQVWDVYHAADPTQLHERVATLQAWAQQTISGTALEAIEKLCAKADRFALAFAYPDAYRTSNMVDRHMAPLERWLASARHFHGHWRSAEHQVRAWALLHNYWPYCPRAAISQRARSPAHHLNRALYHENWLHNLLIATSATGLQAHHRKRQN
ncbi:MAG: hypothetical protein M3220_20450 [Chloroflexota bacterium]|nr:hypothetical protein [Chloroflexota bacterium]